MKTAISIEDSVFREAERFAKQAGKSRSQLYTDALKQYLLAHTTDSVTHAMDLALEQIGESDNGFVSAASRRMLKRESW